MGDGRGVVDAVAYHRHDEVARLEPFDRRGLVVGPGFGFDPIRGDAELAGHRLRGRSPIAGHEPDLDPAVVERPDRRGGRRLERIAERDLSGQRAVDGHPGDRLPGDLGERGGLARSRPAFEQLIERRQAALLDTALELADRIYAEKPKHYARRLHAYWRAWRG